MASLQLILESITQLIEGFSTHAYESPLVFDKLTIWLLVSTIVSKILLWLYCRAFQSYSVTLLALAVDHRNDVLSNLVAVAAACLSLYHSEYWFSDPAGAIIMSIYILYNWCSIGKEQIELLVGRAADDNFIDDVKQLSSNFHPQLIPDIIRAYHCMMFTKQYRNCKLL